jgi:amidohydrolase family protein
MRKPLVVFFFVLSHFLGITQMSMLAIKNVSVIDVKNSKVERDRIVIITGNKITFVGAKTKIPDGATIVDATGKYLMPGLWDMHVHTFINSFHATNSWFFPLFIANGVTGVRDMWTTGDAFAQVLQFRRGMADGSFLGPRYGAVGWLVDGPAPFWRGSDTVTTPQEAREFVHRVKAAGIDFVKVYWKLPREEYFAIADESKKVGIPFAGHVPFAVSLAEASDAGQRTIEHLAQLYVSCSSKEYEWMRSKDQNPEPITSQIIELIDTYDPRKCKNLLEHLAHNQTWVVPTAVMFLRDRSLATLSRDPRAKYLPANISSLWQQVLAKMGNEQNERRMREGLVVLGELNKAGVPLMTGTDVPNPLVYPGFSLHDELALFVQAGLTPGEALKTATYNPAKFLGVLDSLGTIEKGKLADLVLLDANPLEDISNTKKINAVVLNGHFLDRKALDELLAVAEATANEK